MRTGRSLDDCIIRGIHSRDLHAPFHLGRGDVVWPADWSVSMRTEWRRAEGLAGQEWSPLPAAGLREPVMRFMRVAGSVGGHALGFAL